MRAASPSSSAAVSAARTASASAPLGAAGGGSDRQRDHHAAHVLDAPAGVVDSRLELEVGGPQNVLGGQRFDVLTQRRARPHAAHPWPALVVDEHPAGAEVVQRTAAVHGDGHPVEYGPLPRPYLQAGAFTPAAQDDVERAAALDRLDRGSPQQRRRRCGYFVT